MRDCGYSAVVLVGPSHFVGFHGVSIWPRGEWETPLGAVAVAEELAAAIAAESPDIRDHAVAHGREHSLEMQLPFVAHLLPGVPIVPLVMGYQTREHGRGARRRDCAGACRIRSAGASRRAADGQQRPVALRGCGNGLAMDDVVLRHVGRSTPSGLMDALEHEPRHACGGGPMVSVLRAATRLGATRAQVLRYADSGDVSGDKSSVVGYMAAAIW